MNKDIFPDSGYIYLIREEEKMFKIGFTKRDPIKRLSELQCANPRELILFNFFKTSSMKIEKRIHKEFKHKKVNREWFNLSESDLACILDSEWRLIEMGDDYYE